MLPKTNAMQTKDSILNFLLGVLKINSWKETLIIFYLTQYIQKVPYLYVRKIKIINDYFTFSYLLFKSACILYYSTSQFRLAFQMLNSHLWLGVTILDNSTTQYLKHIKL